MFCREDQMDIPSQARMGEYIHNPLWDDLCAYMKQEYHVEPQFAFSKCSLEFGWNIKFKKGSRALCTVYPREDFFVLMVVISRREKEGLEGELSSFCPEIQKIYAQTKEGNGQRWLMIELEDGGQKYEDVKRLIKMKAV